ncbi:MAG: hypothetical protein JWQ03_3216 [Variovorax sp.]|nr:hypothetical protein [Variovorax sp.]
MTKTPDPERLRQWREELRKRNTPIQIGDQSLFFFRPRKGDVWELRFPGKSKKVKTVERIQLRYYARADGTNVRRPTVLCERQPKGRYFDVRVKAFLKWGTLISRDGQRIECGGIKGRFAEVAA